MVDVQHISYAYTKKAASRSNLVLSNITFHIQAGEFVSILGHSGCGKTTLVNILAGYLSAGAGTILINNKKIRAPGRDRIVVNQENDVFPWMTVWDNMRLVNANKETIHTCAKLVGLSDVLNYYPNALSGGMKKRLSLARALVVNPDFLILDEPFASLDYMMRDELHGELDLLFSVTQKTTLLVTHDINEAIYLSDRIIILGGQPTSILAQLHINFSHPRSKMIENSKRFSQYRKRIKESYFMSRFPKMLKKEKKMLSFL